jgi:hypothetical protein
VAEVACARARTTRDFGWRNFRGSLSPPRSMPIKVFVHFIFAPAISVGSREAKCFVGLGASKEWVAVSGRRKLINEPPRLCAYSSGVEAFFGRVLGQRRPGSSISYDTFSGNQFTRPRPRSRPETLIRHVRGSSAGQLARPGVTACASRWSS